VVLVHSQKRTFHSCHHRGALWWTLSEFQLRLCMKAAAGRRIKVDLRRCGNYIRSEHPIVSIKQSVIRGGVVSNVLKDGQPVLDWSPFQGLTIVFRTHIGPSKVGFLALQRGGTHKKINRVYRLWFCAFNVNITQLAFQQASMIDRRSKFALKVEFISVDWGILISVW
jgi:hypothetical protein